jgi:hypothetical protein
MQIEEKAEKKSDYEEFEIGSKFKQNIEGFLNY